MENYCLLHNAQKKRKEVRNVVVELLELLFLAMVFLQNSHIIKLLLSKCILIEPIEFQGPLPFKPVFHLANLFARTEERSNLIGW